MLDLSTLVGAASHTEAPPTQPSRRNLNVVISKKSAAGFRSALQGRVLLGVPDCVLRRQWLTYIAKGLVLRRLSPGRWGASHERRGSRIVFDPASEGTGLPAARPERSCDYVTCRTTAALTQAVRL